MAEGLEFEGVVTEKLPNEQCRVEIDVNGTKKTILAYKAGKMKMNHITLLNGDRVTVEVSPYDLGRGRITYRHR